MSKGTTAMGAVVVLATGGYFGYDYYQSTKKDDGRTANASARRSPGSGTAGEAGEADQTGEDGDAGVRHKVRRLQLPRLVGLTPEQATAKLVELGFKADVLEIPPDFGCSYDDEERDIVPVGTICNQDRAPGEHLMSSSKLRVVVEHDTWEAGGKKSDREWRRMPDLEGMPLDAAKALLRSKGFGDDEFIIGQAMSSCGQGVVCDQRPKKATRKYLADVGELNVGE